MKWNGKVFFCLNYFGLLTNSCNTEQPVQTCSIIRLLLNGSLFCWTCSSRNFSAQYMFSSSLLFFFGVNTQMCHLQFFVIFRSFHIFVILTIRRGRKITNQRNIHKQMKRETETWSIINGSYSFCV